MKHTWQNYLKRLTPKQRDKMLAKLVEQALDDEVIGYRVPAAPEYPDESATEEGLYWKSCGEPVL